MNHATSRMVTRFTLGLLLLVTEEQVDSECLLNEALQVVNSPHLMYAA
jgi:hypothetical protein